MSVLKDRYIRFDWAIKRLLRQKANFGVLEGFLTVLLGEKVTIIVANLKKNGVPIDIISASTGLSPEEIAGL